MPKETVEFKFALGEWVCFTGSGNYIQYRIMAQIYSACGCAYMLQSIKGVCKEWHGEETLERWNK